MYETVIKHSGHLRTLEKCRRHSPEARVFYVSFVFSNARRVLSECNTRLRLLCLLNNTTGHHAPYQSVLLKESVLFDSLDFQARSSSQEVTTSGISKFREISRQEKEGCKVMRAWPSRETRSVSVDAAK